MRELATCFCFCGYRCPNKSKIISSLFCKLCVGKRIVSIPSLQKCSCHNSWKLRICCSYCDYPELSWGGQCNHAAAAAKSLQSCLTLCDPIDGSTLGSPVPGILQARTLEWVAISFSNAWKGKVKVKSLSRVWLLTTPWTTAYQAPPSMGFSRQEYWSGVPLGL